MNEWKYNSAKYVLALKTKLKWCNYRWWNFYDPVHQNDNEKPLQPLVKFFSHQTRETLFLCFQSLLNVWQTPNRLCLLCNPSTIKVWLMVLLRRSSFRQVLSLHRTWLFVRVTVRFLITSVAMIFPVKLLSLVVWPTQGRDLVVPDFSATVLLKTLKVLQMGFILCPSLQNIVVF